MTLVRVYGMAVSGNCWKVRQILDLAGPQYEWIETDSNAGETRTPAFLALNPNGKIPVVVLPDGTVLTESGAILLHFAEGTEWLPAPGLARTRVMEWLFFEQYSHEPYVAVARNLLTYARTAATYPERMAQCAERGAAAFDVMERRLAIRPFLTEGGPTVADLALFAYTHVADEGGFDLARWPGVAAWVVRVAALPEVRPLAGWQPPDSHQIDPGRFRLTDPTAILPAPVAAMTDAELVTAKAAMSRWYWWGIPTFFRCPWIEDPAAADIAVIGVPHSSGNGSTERDQHLGPRAVRHVSPLYRRGGHARFGFDPWTACRIVDAGDAPLPEAMVNDVSVQHIEAFARRFSQAGTRLVSIGGDHSITGPLVRAAAGPGSRLTNGRPAALVHFDSHTDSYEHLPHWLGSRRSAAHWAAYTVTEGHVDATRSSQIGIRPIVGTPGSRTTSERLGYRIIDMDEIERDGVASVIAAVRERVGDAPVYVTFDLDVLDPCDAPGVSNLEPGTPGLRVGEAVRMLQGLRGLDVIGGDVVCLMPTKDSPNQITAMNAMVVAFELISLMADRLRERSDAPP